MAELIGLATTLLPMANNLLNQLAPTAKKAFSGAQKGFCNCDDEKAAAIQRVKNEQESIFINRDYSAGFAGKTVDDVIAEAFNEEDGDGKTIDNEEFDEWLKNKYIEIPEVNNWWMNGILQEELIKKGINIKKQYAKWYEGYYNVNLGNSVVEHKPMQSRPVKHDLMKDAEIATAERVEYKPRTTRHLKNKKRKKRY